MHRIYYKTCSPSIYKHYKKIKNKKLIQEVLLISFNLIINITRYTYMNNSLMSYGPRLWNELNIDKRKLVSISLFSNNIFNYFLTL